MSMTIAASMPRRVRWQINDLSRSERACRTMLAQKVVFGALSGCDCLCDCLGGDFFLREVTMSFFNSTSLDDLARSLADSVPESVRRVGRDLEDNFKAVLQAQLSKLDLVSRQEFDVQAALLARTQASLGELEARLKDIEAKLAPAPP
jgi:BMFP domain-containing protein YqiC